MSETQELNKKVQKKPALGRGLGSLLGESVKEPAAMPEFAARKSAALTEGFVELEKPEKTEAVAAPAPQPQVPDHARIWTIDIAKLKPNQRQPRKIFEAEALKELASSIKEKGILLPIVARPIKDGEFEIIAGERRWRAAQAAGLHQIPVIVKATQDQEALELALIENIQRQDLNPIEQAEAYNHLVQTYNLTQQQLADKLGKDRATVANVIRLLGLARPVREYLAQGQLSMGHAKVLLAVADQSVQKTLADQLVSRKWSVRELEREVAQALKPKSENIEVKSSLDMDLAKKLAGSLAEELQKNLGTKVSIDYDKGRGRISIHFYSDDELNGIVDRMRTAWRK